MNESTPIRDDLAPQSRRVKAGAVELQTYSWGDEEAPPLVLVHGIEDLSWSLEGIAKGLCADRRVIAYDLRGHGDSEQPGVYTMTHHLADLHAVTKAYSLDSFDLVGHSLGGQIVKQYAGTFPERPRRVVSIEGLGPPFPRDQIPPAERRRAIQSGIRSVLQPRARSRELRDLSEATRLFRSFHPQLDAARARRLVELGTRRGESGGLIWKWDPRVRATWLSTSPEIAEERWRWIRAPTLIVTAGRAASFWSQRRGVRATSPVGTEAELERRLGLFYDARHVEIEKSGHMVHFDAEEQLLRLVRTFLDE